MKRASKRGSIAKAEGHAGASVFWLIMFLIFAVPLIFSTAVYRIYSLPKFALLLSGSAALVPLLFRSSIAGSSRAGLGTRLLESRHVRLVSLYLIAVSVSTAFGVAPVASLLGSSYNQMGLITHLCFFICFIALIVGTGANRARFTLVLWAMVVSGLVVATYAYLQFFGRDPFLSSSLYTFDSSGGAVLRVNSTLGHSDYLGNFLLYTTPLSAGFVLASSAWARRLALVALVVSIGAIVFSGTRGAWLGLAVGAVTFITLELPQRIGKSFGTGKRRKIAQASFVLVAVVALILLIGANPASRNILLRARSVAAEGFTGSGRTILWRDSIKMVTASTLSGCGPEGFRKAFLAYKSVELARLAPQTNNESSHSSYIDAAISYGLPGAILYFAVIASSVSLLFAARRRAGDMSLRIIITSLVSSLAAVIVHNFFIFDQISTGLYFFTIAALAQIASNITSGSGATDKVEPIGIRVERSSKDSTTAGARTERSKPAGRMPPILNLRGLRSVFFVTGCGIALLAAWYTLAIAQADMEINKAFVSANAGDLDRVIQHGARAANSPDPAGEYDFLYARALVLCVDRLPALRSKESRTSAEAARVKALGLAIAPAERSLDRTLTPDSNCLLLAYIALQLGDADRLHAYAVQALKWDPNFSTARWLMSEAYLAEGDPDQAAREASIALDLNPSSREARLALRRARGEALSREQWLEQSIQRGLARAAAGNIDKARRLLRRAIAEGPCPECHRALASVCEAAGLYEEAIAEWQAFIREAPSLASAQQIPLRVEALRKKSNIRH